MNKTYQAGMIAAYWADFAAKVIDADAPDVQRSESKQAFLAGAAAFMAAQAHATEAAANADEFVRFNDEIEAEVIAMGTALIAELEAAECNCEVCRAERGEGPGDIRVKTFVRGLNGEQAEALTRLIADFVTECGGGVSAPTLQ